MKRQEQHAARTSAQHVPETEDETAAVAERVEGWLSDRQGRELFRAVAARAARGAIVEIGSWKGRSTVWLAAAAGKAGTIVYAIDRHEGSREDATARTYDDFRRNLAAAGLLDHVRPLVMSSREAERIVKGPVGVLFIDGDHSDAGAQEDFALWLPRLAPGAALLCHDVSTASYSGPRRMFQRMVCRNPQFDAIRRVGSMMVARRTTSRSWTSAAWSLTAWGLLFVYDGKAWLRRIRRGRQAFRPASPTNTPPAAES
jgi:predicted O-methyltransferase YrrM